MFLSSFNIFKCYICNSCSLCTLSIYLDSAPSSSCISQNQEWKSSLCYQSVSFIYSTGCQNVLTLLVFVLHNTFLVSPISTTTKSLVSKYFIHMTPPGSISKLLLNRLLFNVQKSLSMGMFIVDVATTSSSGGTNSGYLLCNSKHLSEWSVLGRRQQISAPHNFTLLISSKHPKYFILCRYWIWTITNNHWDTHPVSRSYHRFLFCA